MDQRSTSKKISGRPSGGPSETLPGRLSGTRAGTSRGAFSMHRELFGRMFGAGSVNPVLGLVAIIILAGSFSVLMYNTFTREDPEVLTVNGKEYPWDGIFDRFEMAEMDGNEGIRISELVRDSGLKDPESRNHRIIAADGYQRTVAWDDLENGLLLRDRSVYFRDLPRQFHVKDVAEVTAI